MIDFSNTVSFHVGETVQVKGFDRNGSIESLRVISRANLVEIYDGAPTDVVVTVQMGDSVVSRRGSDVISSAMK
ncbi:MAG: hypothetical protein RBU29_08325 [bacterium]|jgi:hypothetical protein|nr:hypothetical protein [bacterium]